MKDLRKVRWTLVAVILITFCVQLIVCKAVLTRSKDLARQSNSLVREDLAGDQIQKHLPALKPPNPVVVEKVKKHLRARMKGRRIDQSNERNIWTSHPKNENWSGPDTGEVYEVYAALGI